MLRRVLLAALLLLVAGVPRSVGAYTEGDPSDPIDQYQVDYKRKNLGSALGIDQSKVERLLQIDEKYRTLKRQAIQNARGSLQQLNQVMHQPQPSDGEVRRILDDMMRIRREKLSLEQRQLEEEGADRPPGSASARPTRPPGSTRVPSRCALLAVNPVKIRQL
jgi:hypothetical protein